MIVDELVSIKIQSANFKWFTEKGYSPFRKNDIIKVNVSDLMPSSKCIVRCVCEKCDTIKEVIYQNYKAQIARGGYYVCLECSKHKSQETNIIKYGCKSPLSNVGIRAKCIDSMIRIYGVDNISKLDITKEDRCDNFKTDNFKKKAKLTWESKYGVDNPSKSEEIKNKKIKTNLKNNGVENPSQNSDIFEKSQKSGKKIKLHNCGLMYRGTYEKDFLDFCLINNILVEKGPTIEYIYKNKKKYYHSDFIVDKNLICEIKSSYYYEVYKEINIAKKEYSEKLYNFLFIIDKNYSDLLYYQTLGC